ncbi:MULTISPECIES: ubiquinol oxidase subunit II [Paenibacillus]|uniref:Quinol oxidase subunit 2 n=1 Tax=Paenibacillus amylolyticus TaxID=1451 RepID=A0ABD8AQF7_PAEAM|nr:MULTISPECIES: ubiquinol oxidase subunit II [Paenibacillus]ETT40767.1 ubiquinol oxidase subunit II [Paenibacillus sp. FSL R5-192]ETT54445.1 ubiquinol oxidase subunit II [Paenibacillus sp. FSL H7-689]MBD8841337.1 ubiquinol oxidase subunit II [Paenibacillus sp. CFBP 13594]PJN48463.1 Cytochrome bo(3) ubiquinol oxidase subunit 2 precursor [Paenibacillus sp. GM1FR]PQZ99814.1 ubiquinol oxidase subunit II [Paenibacillus sp. MYb63]
MNKKPRSLIRIIIPVVLTLVTIALIVWPMLAGGQYVVLDPKGPIGASQRDLIVISTILCAVIIVPVLILAAVIVWRYREKPDNKAAYEPNWAHSTKAEVVWWTIPIIIIGILAIVTIRYTYVLEPSKPLAHEKAPITIQVSSLDWKWLFMYPEQGIATVNTLNIPADRPVKFELTADSPMNSFWIPQLGGQIYTMSGMAMTLYLQADHEGKYWGSGANFTGEHFGEMRFDVNATSDEDFDNWVAEVKQSSQALTTEGYKALAEPGTSNVAYYSAFPEGLFQNIVTKYVVDGQSAHSKHGTSKEASGAIQNATDTSNQDEDKSAN